MTQYLHHHPHFGHTLANYHMDHHQHPLSFHGPIVHIKATIKLVEEDFQNPQGNWHQYFLIHQINVVEIDGGEESILGDEVLCSIRYGDHLGLKNRILSLKKGREIELKGEYIDNKYAYPSPKVPGDTVIHFINYPVGFVKYNGKHYE